MEKAKSANGVSGHLLYIHGANTFVFRVYTGNDQFIDYDILHSDLHITIDDPDSAFYTKANGSVTLDHAPETVGKKDIEIEPTEIHPEKKTFSLVEFEGRLAIHAESSQLMAKIRSVVRAGATDEALGAQVRKILDQA